MNAKRLLCTLLAALLLFSLCACAPKQEAAEAPAAAEAAEPTKPAETAGTAAEEAPSEQAPVTPDWNELVYDREMPLSYATQFKVEYAGDSYKRITISDEKTTYLVVAENAPVPENVPADVTVLQQPFDHIYLVASAAMDNFAQLDAIDHITLSGRKDTDWYIEAAAKAMQDGKMVYAGKYSEPDYELIVSSGCDLAIENTMIYHSPEVLEKLQSLGIPVLVESSSYEEEPFGRMEWIKLYASLLDLEDEATALFDEKMAAVSSVLDQEPSGKSVVFFYITSKGAVNVRKTGDYIAKSIVYAGGDYIGFDEDDDGSSQSTVNIQMEAFYAGAKDADLIIYNSIVDGELETIDELVALNPLLADFKAVKDGNVWCLTKNFYQESLELGDLVLDVNEALTDPDAQDLRFLRKMQ